MRIRIDNFILSQSLHAPTKFDLVRVVIRTKSDGSGIKYEAEQEEGFGMTLASAFDKMIASNLLENDAEVNLKEFLETYKKERDKILEIFESYNFKS